MAGLKTAFTKANISQVFQNEAIVAVVSASILAPLVINAERQIFTKLPVLKDHFTIAHLLMALLVFYFAKKQGAGIVRGVIIGVAGANLILALTPFISKFIQR